MEARLRDLIAEVLGIAPGDVGPELSRDSSGWDSLGHLKLITAVEQEYGISFTMDQILAVRSGADLERAITSRFDTPDPRGSLSSHAGS